GFEAITSFNYIDSYEDVTADRTVDYSTTVDVLLEYRFGKGATMSRPEPLTGKQLVPEIETSGRTAKWLKGVAIRAGVRNIFDDPPPFSNQAAGYPVSLEDPRQRFVFFDLEKRF
nr:hypothetical protein [Chthoniobacterales bacterium]